MAMLTDNEKETARMIAGAIFGFLLIYLVASAGGLVPDGYNVFKWMESEPDVILQDGTGYVYGVPTTVNVTAQMNNTHEITFACNESYLDGMELTITPEDDDYENTTFYFTATSTDWAISEDGMSAEYFGEPLTIGVEISTLVLHVDGWNETAEAEIIVTTEVGTLDTEEFTIEVIYEEL